MRSIFFTDTVETNMISKFKFLKILEAFTKGNLSVDIRALRLQSGNDAYDDDDDYFGEIINLVHSEGGWTVYGWGKRGLTNYISVLGNDIKDPGVNRVLSQDISTHVVHPHTSKKDYLDLSTTHGRYLDNLKLDFSTL